MTPPLSLFSPSCASPTQARADLHGMTAAAPATFYPAWFSKAAQFGIVGDGCVRKGRHADGKVRAAALPHIAAASSRASPRLFLALVRSLPAVACRTAGGEHLQLSSAARQPCAECMAKRAEFVAQVCRLVSGSRHLEPKHIPDAGTSYLPSRKHGMCVQSPGPHCVCK